jgi:hypothetical protein
MGPLDATWHLLNFFAPAVGLGLIAASLCKLFWRGALRGVPWWRLAGWSIAATSLALIGGLIAFGRDGKMATYGAMVLSAALALWWAGLRPSRA